MGLVSRVTPVQTAKRNCTRDEGGPFAINDSQHATWCRLIEAFDEGSARYRQLALFPAERSVPDQAQG